MKALAITHVNLLRLSRDRTALFFTFLLPLILILMLGLLFGGNTSSRIGVLVADEGPLGDDLLRRLSADPDLDVRSYNSREAVESAAERQRIVAGVIVPADYSSRAAVGGPANVMFVSEDNLYAPAIRAAISAAQAGQAVEVEAALAAASATGLPFETAYDAAVAAAARLESTPVSVSDASGEDTRPWEPFGLVAAQELLLNVFLVSLLAASQLMLTRQLGISRRMLSTPTSAATILAGEGFGRFAIALGQSIFIVFATALLFDVRWGNPVAAGAVILGFSLVASGIALLIGTIAESEAQATAMSLGAGLILAAVGGCMQPLETFPPVMRTVAHVTPHAWALDALTTVIRSDGGLGDIAVELAVLGGLAIVLLSAATYRLRRSITG